MKKRKIKPPVEKTHLFTKEDEAFLEDIQALLMRMDKVLAEGKELQGKLDKKLETPEE